MQRVRLNAEVEPKLVWYLLNNAVGREQLVFRSSTTTGLANINGKSIAEFILPLPPADEQAAIVHFLDHADRRIRRYIRAKRKLIALLNEQKQVIIQQAVTRGLDPTVPMKDSGVEWLGEIPAHWKVRRVKSLSSVKRGASPRPIGDSRYFSTSGEYAWVRITDVTASDHYLERSSQKLSELGKSLSVALEPGALFLSIAGSVGKPIITRIKCCIHDGFVYFPAFKGNVDFLYYVFASGGLYGGLGKLGTQLNLNTQTVGNIYIGWPSEHEQAAIVSYLDSRLQNNAAASQSVLQQISRMNEYRTRLIADVVTGKLDVREAARHLPDEPDDLDEADDLPLDELNGEEDDLAELAEEPDAD